MSSGYENVVGGKLKLKGKALDVKATSGGGIYKHKKKKKNKDKDKKDKNEQSSHPPADQTKLDTSAAAGSDAELFSDPTKEEEEEEEEVGDAITTIEDNAAAAAAPTHWDANLTPAERRYVEQRARIDMHRLAKTANKSHRDRIQDFNQYLANMSEHYDIPKVGPG